MKRQHKTDGGTWLFDFYLLTVSVRVCPAGRAIRQARKSATFVQEIRSNQSWWSTRIQRRIYRGRKRNCVTGSQRSRCFSSLRSRWIRLATPKLWRRPPAGQKREDASPIATKNPLFCCLFVHLLLFKEEGRLLHIKQNKQSGIDTENEMDVFIRRCYYVHARCKAQNERKDKTL